MKCGPALLVLLVFMLVAACTSIPPAASTTNPPATSPAAAPPVNPPATPLPAATDEVAATPTGVATAPAPTSEAAAAIPEEKPWEDLDPSRFSRSTQVDNRWLPLRPGTRLTYEGMTIEDDGKVIPHRVVINVTDLIKTVGGVRSVVTWDLDYSDGELVEAELAFLAQDDDDQVWRMGEYPEVYEEGEFVEAPAWIHGIEEARAGIMMLADPQVGTRSYAQGWAPAVDWTDRGRVDQVGEQICVPAGCYQGVLVIAETSRSEPNAEQLKTYAAGVGNVRVGWRGAEEKTKESLELVKIEQLTTQQLAEVRTEALKLEKHAYEVSPEVYGSTPPAE